MLFCSCILLIPVERWITTIPHRHRAAGVREVEIFVDPAGRLLCRFRTDTGVSDSVRLSEHVRSRADKVRIEVVKGDLLAYMQTYTGTVNLTTWILLQPAKLSMRNVGDYQTIP